MIGPKAVAELLDRDRLYVRLTRDFGTDFHYTYLDELEPLLQMEFRLSKGRQYLRGDSATALSHGKLLSLVDSCGNEVADHSVLRRFRMESPREGEVAPWFGPLEITFTLRDRRMFRNDVYRATFLCPAEFGYIFYSRFVSKKMSEHLEKLPYGYVHAHHVAPYFLIDQILSSFSALLIKVDFAEGYSLKYVLERIETYLARQFVSMSLLASFTTDREQVARRLYGISDRLHIAVASIAKTLVDAALEGNAYARDFVVSEVWRLFPEDTPPPSKKPYFPILDASASQASKAGQPTSKADTQAKAEQGEREKIDRADDANETFRISISAITSALNRTFPSMEPLAATNMLKTSSEEDESTKSSISMLLKRTVPSSAETTHRWCVELLPKALALIAQQGK